MKFLFKVSVMEERLNNIDNRLAALVTTAENFDRRLTALLRAFEQQQETTRLLVDGVGSILEGLSEIKATTQEQAAIVREQAATARAQAANIDRLTRIVEQILGHQGGG